MTDDNKQSPQDSVAQEAHDSPTEDSGHTTETSVADPPVAQLSGSKETPDTKADAGAAASVAKTRSGAPWWSLFLLLLILLIGGAVVALGWYGYQFYQQDASKSGRVSELQAQLSGVQEQQQAFEAARQQQADQLQATQQQLRAANERIEAAEQRLAAQNKRLLAMSTITREDWLLAEAEYLLKLANQRILIERSATGAEALLTEADNILRDLDDPDLFSLRKAVNSDLAALRLVKKIDTEGIYLQINGLIEQLTALPIKPDRQQVLGVTEKPTTHKLDDELTTETWWQAVRQNIAAFGASLKNYIAIDRHGERPKPILAPESAQYLQQNARLMMERAQLALLREQQAIYQNSLRQAEQYLADFYPNSTPVNAYREQLLTLSTRNIERQLPDITGSLELLHAYIEALHNLKGAKPAATAGGASQ